MYKIEKQKLKIAEWSAISIIVSFFISIKNHVIIVIIIQLLNIRYPTQILSASLIVLVGQTPIGRHQNY